MIAPPPATRLRRPHGALKTWLQSIGIGQPVTVASEGDAASLRSCAWQSGYRAEVRQARKGSRERIFTIVGPL